MDSVQGACFSRLVLYPKTMAVYLTSAANTLSFCAEAWCRTMDLDTHTHTHEQRLSPAQPATRTDSNIPNVSILSADIQAQALTSLSIRQLDWTSEFCISLSQTAAPSETRDNPLDYWHCEGILVRFHNNPQQQFNHRFPLTHAIQMEQFHFSKMQQNLMWSYSHTHNSPGVQQQHRCSSLFLYLSSICPVSAVLLYAPHLWLTSSRVMERKRSKRKWKEREKQTGRESRRESEERTLHDRVSKRTNRKEDRGEWRRGRESKRGRDTLLH